ncbi:MAG: hypothetical protein LH465_01595 [Sphingomonas bacterium]|nr:hypothetical protein [Sphingomonas bacterium]
MSRFDGVMRAASEGSVELEELLAAFGKEPVAPTDRSDAMAQFLSAAEGWRDAKATLRGTFAGPGKTGTGLTDDQDK